jgi:hypothetical protein
LLPIVKADDAVFAIVRSGAPTVTGSLALSLAPLVSPAVATDAVLVTVGSAAAPTVTVSVIAVDAPAAMGPGFVHVTVAPAFPQVQPLPVAEL